MVAAIAEDFLEMDELALSSPVGKDVFMLLLVLLSSSYLVRLWLNLAACAAVTHG